MAFLARVQAGYLLKEQILFWQAVWGANHYKYSLKME